MLWAKSIIFEKPWIRNFKGLSVYLFGPSSLAYATADYDRVIILLGYGNDNFYDWKVFPADYKTSPFSVLIADFDSDKKLDFIVSNYGTKILHTSLCLIIDALKKQIYCKL